MRLILPLLLLFSGTSLAQTSWTWTPKTLELHGDMVSFEWAVPKLSATPGDTAQWQKLLDRAVAERLNEFQTAFEEARRENVKLRRENPEYTPNPWESQGGYQAVWADNRRLVLLWQGYDYRGGAHGLPFMEVTVLDSEQPDSLLPPSSLFNDEAAVLEALSAASRASLQEQLTGDQDEDDWLYSGTSPKWENFTVVYPTSVDGPDRWEVIFPSYQVAPYAAGTPTVTIPWETLSPMAPSLQAGASHL
jgi:hypothetical protein